MSTEYQDFCNSNFGPEDAPTREDQETEAWEYWHQRACKAEAEIACLKRELATRAIRTMGPRSPYWNCTICGAAHQTPSMFTHKPECLLADTPNPAALVPESRHKHFYSIEVQHAQFMAALERIAGGDGYYPDYARTVLYGGAEPTAVNHGE